MGGREKGEILAGERRSKRRSWAGEQRARMGWTRGKRMSPSESMLSMLAMAAVCDGEERRGRAGKSGLTSLTQQHQRRDHEEAGC